LFSQGRIPPSYLGGGGKVSVQRSERRGLGENDSEDRKGVTDKVANLQGGISSIRVTLCQNIRGKKVTARLKGE